MQTVTMRKRGRPRKIFTTADVDAVIENDRAKRSNQTSAFPSIESAEIPSDPLDRLLERDAKEKGDIKDAVAKIPEIFTAKQVKWCFDAYVAILCFIYSIALKTDFKALQEELAFSEEQKDAMAEPLARICSKYAPSSWAGMAAEIELITMLGLYTVSSFGRAKNVAIAQVEKQRNADRTQPVAPMNRNRQEVHVPA